MHNVIDDLSNIETLINIFRGAVERIGLRINEEKIIMEMAKRNELEENVSTGGMEIKVVEAFSYRWIPIAREGKVKEDINE